MGAAYVIFGKSVPAKNLAIGTIAAVVGGVQLSSYMGGEAAAAPAAPAAAKPAEGDFDVEKAINEFIAGDKQ